MAQVVDARGYSCPIPVVMVQKEVKATSPETLEVLVDARVAVENITRYAESCGYSVSSKEEGPDFRIALKK